MTNRLRNFPFWKLFLIWNKLTVPGTANCFNNNCSNFDCLKNCWKIFNWQLYIFKMLECILLAKYQILNLKKSIINMHNWISIISWTNFFLYHLNSVCFLHSERIYFIFQLYWDRKKQFLFIVIYVHDLRSTKIMFVNKHIDFFVVNFTSWNLL